jgi:hypothetical protein
MDSNQLIKATSDIQVEKSMPSTGSNSHELAAALVDTRIAVAPDAKIKGALKYAMLLIGLKEQTIDKISEEEKKIMVNYLRKYFGGHTCKEINLSFEKAIAGELPIEPNDVKAYENFSCAYVGNILRAYRQWAKTEIKEGGVKLPEPDKKELPAPVQTDQERFDFWKAEILGGITIDFVTSDVYELIIRVTGIEPSNAGIGKALSKAQSYLLGKIAQEKSIITEEKHPAQYWEITALVEKLNSEDGWQTLPDVQKLAKAFWCQSYFLHTNLKLPTTNVGEQQNRVDG